MHTGAKVRQTENNEQLRDLIKMIKTMREQKAKFVKNCDENNMKAVLNVMNGPNSDAIAVGREMLDDLVKFITRNTDATYAKDGAEIFETSDSYTKKIKDCDPKDLDR